MQEKVSSREAERLGLMPYSLLHLLGDGACHDDGHGVVGGGDIHEAHQQADAQLAAPLAAEHPADEGEDALGSRRRHG